MNPIGNGLESDPDNSNSNSGIELSFPSPEYIKYPNPKDSSLSIAYNKTALLVTSLALLIIIIVGLGSYGLSTLGSKNKPGKPENIDQLAANYAPENLSVQNLKETNQLQLGETDHLDINGQLQVNKTLVISPTSTPSAPTAGEIYYNQSTNQPYYYNGSQFVGLATQSPQGITSLNGVTGALVLGNGLQIAGNQLSLSGAVIQALTSANINGPIVTSLQGLTGKITVSGSANQIVVSTASGNINIALPQNIGTTSDVQFGSLSLGNGNLTLTPNAFINSDNISTINNGDTLVINGGNNITFENQDGANTFTFPTSGGTGQVICTTAISCASGGGQAVLLEPTGVQTTSANKTSIFVNKTGGTGNLIELQTAGNDAFVINNGGATTITTLSVTDGITTNSITPDSSLTIGSESQPLTLQGNGQTELTSTSGSFTTTVDFTAPSTNRTITFPDQNGTVCLSVGNCLGGNGGANTSLSNLNNVSINSSLLPDSAGIINLGSSTVPFGQLYLAGGSGTPGINNFVITGTSTSGTRTISLPDANGTVCLQNSAACGFVTTGSDVAQLDGLNGALSISDTTPSGSTITIDDASTSSKGISEFNSTNFSVVNGLVNTIQNINSTAAPSFGGLTLGTAGSVNGLLSLANSTNTNLVSIQGIHPSGTGNATIDIPSIAGGTSDTVCLLTLANCVGTGGGVSTSGGTQNYVPKYNNAGATQISNSEIYDNGSGVAIGSTTITGLFNVGTASQFNVSNTGAVTAVGVNSGTGLIQGTGGLTVSGGSGANISGGLNNNAGGISSTGTIGGVTGYTQTSGTHSVTSSTTSGNIDSIIDSALNANNAALNQLTFTNANSTGTATTVNGLSISPAGTASGNNVINAINLSNVTPVAGNTFNGLYFGSGYNSLLNYNGTPLINGTGILQSAAVSGSYGNLTGTGALSSGSIGSGFGSISTTNSIATTSSLQGGTLSLAGGDLTVDASGDLVTSGTGTFQGGLTVGNAGSTVGNLYLANATSSRLVDIQGLNPTGTGNATIDIPSIAGGTSDTVCLLTLANCVGTGGGVSTSGGTQNYVPKYNNAGATQISNSEIYDNGSGVAIGSTTITGLFNVGTASQFNVSNTGAVTAVGVNSGTGLIQGSGGINESGAYTQTGVSTNTFSGASTFSAAGTGLSVSNNETIGGTLNVQGANITVGDAGATSGSIELSNSSGSNLDVIQGLYATGTGNATYTLPSIAGGTSDTICLKALDNCSASGGGPGAYIDNQTSLQSSANFNIEGVASTVTAVVQGASGGVDIEDLVDNGGNTVDSFGSEGALTLGTAGSTNGTLQLANSSNTNLDSVNALAPSGTGNATIDIPSIAGGTSDTVCLLTLANCVGTGGGVSTSGGTQNYVPKYNNAGATQISNSEIYDNGSGVAIGSTTITGLFNVGTASQFNVSNTGAVTAVGVNSGTGLIQGTGGLTVSGGSGANISGGLNNNAGGISSTGTIGGVTGYTQTSGTHSVTSSTTSGNIDSIIDSALNANNAALNQLTFTNANSTGTATTVNGLSISPAGTASGNNVINAINLSNVTPVAGNTFNGLYFGSGYNSLLNYNGTPLINGTGILQSAAVSGSYGNLTGTGALSSGSIGSGFGSISTTNSIATTSSLQGGTLSLAGGDLTVDASGDLVTSGTGTFQGGLTVGNAGSTVGNLYLANATSSRLVDIQGLNPTGTGNATIDIPSIAGGTSDTVCLLTLANCVGTGGGVSTSGGTQNYVPKYNNAGATQISNSEIYDNGSGVAIGSTTITGLFNVGTASQFNVSNTGAVTAVGVNSGTGLIQGTGGLTVSGGSGANISGGLNNNAGGISSTGTIGGVTGYTQTSGTHSVTSSTTSGNIDSIIDSALNANNAALNQLTFTNANSTGTATTVNGLSISPAGTASGNNVINAINLSNVTPVAGNTFNGLYFGSGYNSLLNYNGTPLINGTGILQSAAVSGSYGNLTGTGALSSGSIGSGFGSISTTNSIATTSSLQGGTLSLAGGDLTVDASGDLVTSGTGTFQGGLTVGNAGSTVGNLYLANATSSRLVDIQGLNPTGTGNATIDIPSIAGGTSDTVCLLTLANCVGTGGGVSTSGGTQNYVPKYNNAGATQISNSEIYDNGSGVAIGSTTITGLFNVGTASQFNVSNTGAVTAVGVNSGTGLIQGTGGLTVSGGSGANISGGLNNNAGGISSTGTIGGVTGYTQTSGTHSVTSSTTSGNIDSIIDSALNANNAALNQLTFTNANSTGTATTVNGLSISPAGTASGNNVINAINLSNVTPVAGNTFNGLYFGSGYNSLLNYNGTPLINGTGILQSAAVSGSYGNLTGTGALSSGSIGSGFGSISTTNSIATTSSLQGGTLSLAGGDLTVDASGDLVTNGSGEFYSSLTLGGAGSATGELYFGNTINTNLLQVEGLGPTGVGNATIDLPSIPAGNTDTVCLLTLANCVGRGGGVSTSGGTQNYVPEYSNGTATQLSNSQIYDNGSGVAIGSSTVTGLLNVGTASQFNVSNTGAVTAVGVNSGTGLIQGTGGLNVNSNTTSEVLNSSGIMDSTSTDTPTAYQLQNSDGESILEAGTSSPTNYIADADFADGSGSSLTDWSQVGNPSIYQQNTTVTSTYEGETSLEEVLGGASEGYETPGSGAGLTSSPITNNLVDEYYTVSFEALSSLGIPASTFTITAYDSTGNQTCTGLIDGSGSNVLSNSGFEDVYCTLQFTSGSTGSISQIKVTTSISSGVVYYDAVQLQLATTASTSSTPSAFQEGTLELRGLITNPLVMQNVTNSQTAFQIQSAGGSSVLDVDTLDNDVYLGNNTGLFINGSTTYENISNSNTITLSSGATTSSYSLTLPTTGPATSQCLQSSSSAPSQLIFASCSTGGSTTLQQAYNNSAGASPDVIASSSDLGFTIQNANSGGLSSSSELFGVHSNASSGLGSSLFSVDANGDTSIASSDTSGNALSVTANSISSGNGESDSFNGLTSGNGLDIATDSAIQSGSGSLLNVTDTATLTSSGGSDTGSLLNISRDLTSSISGATTLTPTLDTSTTFSRITGSVSSWTTSSFTVGSNNDRFLIVAVAEEGQATSGPTYGYPASVSYGSKGMTMLGSPLYMYNSFAPYYTLTYWVLTNPTTGSNTFTVTPNSQDSDQVDFDMVADSWYNVSQVVPFGSFSSNTGVSGGASLSASSAANRVVVDAVGSKVGASPTKGSGQTLTSANAAGNLSVGSSYEAASGSSTSMSWTISGNTGWAEAAVDLIGAANSSETVSSNVATISNNCTYSSSSICTDSTNVLEVNQQYDGATGAALGIENSGQGFGLQIQNGSGGSALTVNTSYLTPIDTTTSDVNATLTLGSNSGYSIAAEGAVSSNLGDYAEYFKQSVAGQLSPGDITCIDASGTVEPCNTGNNDDNVVGVVSTAPGFVGNNQIYNSSNPSATALVSMLGQVPVKVSSANGPINVGDMLTMSSTDGVAVKAVNPGEVIGTALGSYSGNGVSTIQVYIHIQSYDPIANGLQTSNGSYAQNGYSAEFSQLNVSGTLFTQNLSVSGNATIGSLTVNSITLNGDITVNGHIISGGNTPSILNEVNNCTDASPSISGTDTAGLITLTTNSACTVNNSLLNIKFSNVFTNNPNISLTPANESAAKLQTYVDSDSTSDTGFTISTTSSSLDNLTTYKWYYQVIQ